MQFAPKTEDECKRVLMTGDAKFTVKTAVDEVSSSGNDTIKLGLECVNGNNETAYVFCYLTEKMPHLLRHFAYAAGIGDLYEAGNFTADDCVNREGDLVLAIQKGKDGYPDQSKVVDFKVGDAVRQSDTYKQAKTQHASAGSPGSQGDQPQAGKPGNPYTPIDARLANAKRDSYLAYVTRAKKANPAATDAAILEDYRNAAAAYFGSREAAQKATADQISAFHKDNWTGIPQVEPFGGNGEEFGGI